MLGDDARISALRVERAFSPIYYPCGGEFDRLERNRRRPRAGSEKEMSCGLEGSRTMSETYEVLFHLRAEHVDN
jgi:hypothetical protein